MVNIISFYSDMILDENIKIKYENYFYLNQRDFIIHDEIKSYIKEDLNLLLHEIDFYKD